MSFINLHSNKQTIYMFPSKTLATVTFEVLSSDLIYFDLRGLQLLKARLFIGPNGLFKLYSRMLNPTPNTFNPCNTPANACLKAKTI